jgi:hypothetical protein
MTTAIVIRKAERPQLRRGAAARLSLSHLAAAIRPERGRAGKGHTKGIEDLHRKLEVARALMARPGIGRRGRRGATRNGAPVSAGEDPDQ